MIKNKLNCITPERFFLCGLIFLVCLTLLQLPINNGEVFFSLLHPDSNDTFMDFFNSIYDASFEDPYGERGVIYPPLTYLFYRTWEPFLSPRENADAIANELGLPLTGARYWRSTQSGNTIIAFITLASVYMLYRTFIQGQEDNKLYRKSVSWILLGTVPFWYLYERGNLALQTLLFLIFFLKNYQSEDKIRRELSLISLAIAVSFKIYPVVFGVLLIIDKKYKETIRCIIYGAMIFFLPFILFGGREAISAMISNIMATTQNFALWGPGYKVNIDNTIAFLTEPFPVQLTTGVVITVKLLLLGCMLLTLFFTKKEWQRYMVLSAVMMVFPGFSYTYTIIFAAIPLCFFILEKPKTTLMNLLFSLLFLGMFAPFPFGGPELFKYAPKPSPLFIYPLNLTTVISSLSLLGILLLISIDVILCRFYRRSASNSHISRCDTTYRVVAAFFIILFVIIIILFCGYKIYDTQYKESCLLTEDAASEIKDILSSYVESDQSILYFSHMPFFQKRAFNNYGEVRWLEISNKPQDQILPADHETLSALLESLKENLPKAFLYCVYPKPPLEGEGEISEDFEQVFTIEDHLRQFVFENGYTLRGSVSVEGKYRILVYINLQENK